MDSAGKQLLQDMEIPLNEFEQHIDEVILQRGLTYFKKGQVDEPEEVTAGVYETTVRGTEDYVVKLTVKNQVLTDYWCSCPYDMGPVCKHVAAVIFYLQQDALDIKPKVASGKAKATADKPVKKKTSADKVADLLDKLSHEELKEFITAKSTENSGFRSLFLASFAHLDSKESKAMYAKQVKAILRAAKGRDNFIYGRSAREAGSAVWEMMLTAEKQLASNHIQSAIFICCGVLEEMTKALQFADDSNGDIGDNITSAFEMLKRIAAGPLTEKLRVELFEYAVKAFETEIFEGWDWHEGMLEIASALLVSEKEADTVNRLLSKAIGSKFFMERLEVIQLSVIRKIKGESEAQAYIEQHLANDEIRKAAIETAIAGKDYEKATSISKAGIEHDAKDRPGLVPQWHEYLLKIAQAKNDREAIISEARHLLLDNFRPQQDHFQVLKATVIPSEWDAFIEKLLIDLPRSRRGDEVEPVVYIKEQMWDRLLKHISRRPHLSTIEHYETHLAPHYPAELADLYGKTITDYLMTNVGRNHYVTACRYLRRMIKLGAREKVNELVAQLRGAYKNRPSLMEELDKL